MDTTSSRVSMFSMYPNKATRNLQLQKRNSTTKSILLKTLSQKNSRKNSVEHPMLMKCSESSPSSMASSSGPRSKVPSKNIKVNSSKQSRTVSTYWTLNSWTLMFRQKISKFAMSEISLQRQVQSSGQNRLNTSFKNINNVSIKFSWTIGQIIQRESNANTSLTPYSRKSTSILTP